MEEYKKSLIGLTKQDAINKIESDNYDYRIVREDGINYVVTCDFKQDRIDLCINNNIITNA